MSINSDPSGGRSVPSDVAVRAGGLPMVPLENLSVQEMVRMLREQSAALRACGEALIKQQEQLALIAQHVVMVRQSLVPLTAGPTKGPNRVAANGPVAAIPAGHPGYTVKEMANLVHRSIWYVYRRVKAGEYTVTSTGRITHDSYLRAITTTAFISRKPRRRKW